MAWTEYDRLVVKLICILTGDILPLPRWDDDKRHDQMICIAVCETTGMTPERWDTLDKPSREPWLEKTIAALAGDLPAAHRGRQADPTKGIGRPRKKGPTVDERMGAMLRGDPSRVEWPAPQWATRLSDDLGRTVSAAAVKQTPTWKKQIIPARAMMKADRAARGQ